MSDTDTNPSELARRSLLEAALQIAPFEGWNSKMMKDARSDAGLPHGADELYFPGGPLELIDYWNEVCDQAVEKDLQELDLKTMRIRDKVTAGVLSRL